MTVTVNWETATSVPAAAMRLGLVAAMAKSAAVTARDGVLRSGALAVTAPGGSMAVSIAPGQAMISGYQLTNDATATVTLDVGGATARTDLIVARVYDAEAGDAQTLGAIEVVKGTSAAVPATPARAIALASVSVAASSSTVASGALTDRRQWTAGAGGMLLLPGGLASAPPSGLDDGTPVWDAQAHQIGVKEGATWRKFTDVGSLIGPWTSITTFGAGYSSSNARVRVENGRVWVDGFLSGGFAQSTTVSIMTIPSGFRPTRTLNMAVSSLTASGSDQAMLTLRISIDGTVNVINHTSGATPSNVELGQLSWPTS